MLVMGLSAALAVWAVAERNRIRELTRLQDAVRRARATSEECRRQLDLREAAFRALDARVDSLRGEVARFEALDPRGVPQPRYEAYLDEVTRYNRSVEAWEARAQALLADQASCRETVEGHNRLADSLRALLGGAGAGTPAPQP